MSSVFHVMVYSFIFLFIFSCNISNIQSNTLLRDIISSPKSPRDCEYLFPQWQTYNFCSVFTENKEERYCEMSRNVFCYLDV